jgi:hypothetical protein
VGAQKIIRVEEHCDRVEVEYDTVIVEVDGQELEAGLLLKLTDEGLIIDVTDKDTGEILLSAWQLIEDLVAIAH